MACVWLSTKPLDCKEGVRGDVLLAIDRLDEVFLAEFEWVEEGETDREALIPAARINGFVAVTEIDEEE